MVLVIQCAAISEMGMTDYGVAILRTAPFVLLLLVLYFEFIAASQNVVVTTLNTYILIAKH